MGKAKDNTVKLYAALNEENKLNDFIWFIKIKYSNLYNNIDLNGGHFKANKMTQLATELNISSHYLIKLFKRFQKHNWVNKTFTGFRLKGWKSVASYYVPDINKIAFFKDDKKEIIDLCAFFLITTNIKQQIFKRGLRKRKILLYSEDFSMSVRNLSKKLGYKSPMSGSIIEKRLENKKMMKVFRTVKKIGTVEEYPHLFKFLPELGKKSFIKNGIIYERLRNNLIPII